MRGVRRLGAVAICLVAVGSGLGACSDQPAVCDDVDALKSSMENIRDAQLGENGLDTVTTQLALMKNSLLAIRGTASSQYPTQVAAVRSAADNLTTAVSAAKADPTASSIAAVAGDISALGSAVNDLGTALKDTC